MADLDRRSNPAGFEGSTRPVVTNPQAEQQTTDVNVLIKADQTISREGMGKADIKPGPDEYGSPTKG
jgi:hypothetical protein